MNKLKIPLQVKKIWKSAVQAQKKAYCPYSKYKVGASILASNHIIHGSNIENASFGATICAERVAINTAISQGKKNFSHLVIVVNSTSPVAPCGICRQVLVEFCSPEMDIWLASPHKIQAHMRLKDLLPYAFKKKDLKKK